MMLFFFCGMISGELCKLAASTDVTKGCLATRPAFFVRDSQVIDETDLSQSRETVSRENQNDLGG